VSETSYKDQKFSLVFFDTACEEVYDQLRPLCYPEANVFVVCFSVVNMQSFLNVKDKWIPEFQQLLPKVPFVLVGTKLDLREDEEVLKKLEEKETSAVTEEMGNKLKIEVGAAAYIECSARTGIKDLKEIFNKAAEVAVDSQIKEKKDCLLM
jgi:small GTP-binding protein